MLYNTRKTDRDKYGKNLIPYGRMFGINNERGRFKIFHEYENHANDAWYGDTLVVRSWGVLEWNEYAHVWQQVGKYYTKYGNALRLMLELAK